MARELPRPTDAELEILTILWSRGPSSVREVHETISRRRPAQYSTVLKFLQIMAEKGLVRRNKEQRAHIYEAAQPREWTQRQLAAHLLERAFGGNPTQMLIGALSARKSSKRELAEMRELLQKYERAESKKSQR